MNDSLMVFEDHGRVAVAKVCNTPRIDQSNCDLFGASLQEYLEAHPGAHMLVCLEGISYISSSVLSELIHAMRKTASKGGSLRVCAVSEYVESVFEVTQLTSTFHIGKRLDEALRTYLRDLEAAHS